MQHPHVNSLLESHLQSFFTGHKFMRDRWENGPQEKIKLLSKLRIVKISPGPIENKAWTYVSIGASAFDRGRNEALEFMILAPQETPRITELLTMTADYHRAEQLGMGQVFPIGEGWLPDSECDHFLVSLPQPFGPKLEICHISDDFHIRIAWLLPITKAEKDFAATHTQEELETRFETIGIEYLNPKRKSAI